MLATVLCLALFAYLSVVGYAILSLLLDEDPLYLLLLSPVIGTAALMLLTFSFNQFGVPIRYIAHALVLVMLAAAGIVLWRWGRRIKIHDFWPYALLICFALLITGWPMLRFGFDWVSFCNDDMANYCLGAERILNYGYFQMPDSRAVAGTDYTQILWYLHVLHRPGSEMVLADVARLTGLSPLRIFMPTVLAFLLCQISAAGAMAYAAMRSRLAVWMTLLLVGLSALAAFGALYQLIAQVIGLGMLAGLASLLLRPIDDWLRGSRVKRGILIGLLTTGLVFCYPEVLPFMIVAFGFYLLLTFRSWKARPLPALGILGIGAAVLVVLLNRFLPFTVAYIYVQLGYVPAENPATTLFPYYMMPSGPVYFWGMHSLGAEFPEQAWMSFLVASSLLLSAAVVALIVRSAKRREAPAVMSLVMLGVFGLLFYKHSGFRMYKLGMYMQPFILTAVVVGWMSLWRWRIVQVAPLLGLGLLGWKSHQGYAQTSLGESRGGFSEIRGASSTHLVREFADLLAANPGRPVEMDTYNIVLAKFLMLEARGRASTFLSSNFLHSFGSYIPSELIGQARAHRAHALLHANTALYPLRVFDMHAPHGEPEYDLFNLDTMNVQSEAAAPLMFVGSTGRQAPFNRWYDPEEVAGNFRCGGVEEFPNHLIFVVSKLGQPYYVLGLQQSAIYQLEEDLMFPDRTMASIGRYLLFEVIHPSAKFRMEISLTDSLAGDRQDRLPWAAQVIGISRSPMVMKGRGAARVVSEPLTPQVIDGHYFLAVDMGTDGTFFNNNVSGLMRLWGRDVRLDHRQMVGFLRDFSLISEDQYQAISPPNSVRQFPNDLMDRNLEFSGIYEDGWLSDQSFVILSQPAAPCRIVCKLLVPNLGSSQFSTELGMRVDGKEVARKTVGVGDVELSADLPAEAGHRRIDLSFSKMQNFPDPDGRPIAAKVKSIGIEPIGASGH